MENDSGYITADLKKQAQRMADVWPDELGKRFALWMHKSAERTQSIARSAEELSAEARVIRKACEEVIGESESEDVKKLTLHR